MTGMVRRGGQATLADGTEVVWSVADGRRGRRWRSTMTRDGTLAATMLLEVGADGRPARLELATAAGLLTLHPEPTGSLHGNAVTADGVRHLAFDWSPEHELEVDGLPIGQAVAARRLAASMAVGEGTTVPVVTAGLDLSVRESRRRYLREGETSWRIEGDGDPESLAIDERGIPRWAIQAGDWALEREPGG